MRRGLLRFFSIIQEYLFPLFCLSCEKEGDWVCADCFSRRITISGVFYCPICHMVTEGGVACDACRPSAYITRHTALMPYHEKAFIAELLHTIKYNFSESAFIVLDRCIALFFKDRTDILSDIDVIVPVPLHARRFAERGFNQAEKIASHVATCTAIPIYTGGLSRPRKTLQQALLSKSEREKNVENAFVARPVYKGKTILLVDDVYTTGSTMQACAKALLAAGAKEVRGFSIARG